MAEFDDNEELKSFRHWWSNNGTSAIIGVLVAILIVGGWYGWQWYTERQDTQAANLYSQVRYGIAEGKMTSGMKNVIEKLKNDYSRTPYAGAAALTLGAYQVDKGKLDEAMPELDWAMHNAQGEGIRQVATVRKARLLWSQGKNKEALKLLQQDHPAEFDSLYAELTGDIHAAEGQREAAHAAYEKALAALPSDVSKQVLEYKLRKYASSDDNEDASSRGKTADS